MDNTYTKIEEEVRCIFAQAGGCHDLDHTRRVLDNCLHIGAKEGADLEVLRYAALLHDIARRQQDQSKGRICHAEEGAAQATQILERHGFPPQTIQSIIHCIETHRFRNHKPPLTLEAKVLYDADKLDNIGAIGIGRAFVFAGEHHARVHDPEPRLEDEYEYTSEDTAYREYLVKLSRIKDRLMTREGRRIAEGRHRFMAIFFERLNREVRSED